MTAKFRIYITVNQFLLSFNMGQDSYLCKM